MATAVFCFCKWINLTQAWGLLFIGLCFSILFLGGWMALYGIPLWKPLLQLKSILFWWSNCDASDSKSFLFWLVHGEVKYKWQRQFSFFQMDQPRSCGAYFLLGCFFPYCFLGGEQLWRASPFENHFCNWNRCSFDEATVMLLIPSQFCFGWSMVEFGTSKV